MAARVLMADAAAGRLAGLGLTTDLVERVVRRADAEAAFCTLFDPPVMEGLTRWARTNRFLREELVPLGWGFDNPRNLPRTIHPGGQFAIVATTGDDVTGLAGLLPAPKYAKGDATVCAVAANEQLTLDFGEPGSNGRGDPGAGGLPPRHPLLTWLLLFHAGDDGFHVELSLPDRIEDGRITRWAERIILPVFPRGEIRLPDDLASPDTAGDRGIVVEVSRL
jgi:hypothetical protein